MSEIVVPVDKKVDGQIGRLFEKFNSKRPEKRMSLKELRQQISDGVVRAKKEDGKNEMTTSERGGSEKKSDVTEKREFTENINRSENTEEDRWDQLLNCASHPALKRYRTKGFFRLQNDLYLYLRNPYAYIFTPFFAGKEKVFTSSKWTILLKRMFGNKSAVEKIDLRIPSASKTNLLVDSYFYLTVNALNALSERPSFIPGPLFKTKLGVKLHFDPKKKLSQGEREQLYRTKYYAFQSERNFWGEEDRKRVTDPRVEKIFLQELTNQVERSKKSTQPLSAKNFAAKAFSSSCIAAGKAYGIETITKFGSAN